MNARDKLIVLINRFKDNRVSYNDRIADVLHMQYPIPQGEVLNEKIIDYLFDLSTKVVSKGLTSVEKNNIETLSKIATIIPSINKQNKYEKTKEKAEEIMSKNKVQIGIDGMILEAGKWISFISDCIDVRLNMETDSKKIESLNIASNRCDRALELLNKCADSYSVDALPYEEAVCAELYKYSIKLLKNTYTRTSTLESFDKIDSALISWSRLTSAKAKKAKEYRKFNPDTYASILIQSGKYKEELEVIQSKLNEFENEINEDKENLAKIKESRQALKDEIESLQKQFDELRKQAIANKITKDRAVDQGKEIQKSQNRLEKRIEFEDKRINSMEIKIGLREYKHDNLEYYLGDVFMNKNNLEMLRAYMKYVNLEQVASCIDESFTKEESMAFFKNMATVKSLVQVEIDRLVEEIQHFEETDEALQIKVDEGEPKQKAKKDVDAEFAKMFGEENIEEIEQEETQDNDQNIDNII